MFVEGYFFINKVLVGVFFFLIKVKYNLGYLVNLLCE